MKSEINYLLRLKITSSSNKTDCENYIKNGAI